MENKKQADWFHHEYPKTLARDNFLGQVRRTINGHPIDQAQIDLILQSVTTHLALTPHDILLDLGCGNGHLISGLFDQLKGYCGVDFSEYMINIAREYFEREGSHVFINENILSFVNHKMNAPTKCLCYGTFQYLEKYDAEFLLLRLKRMFSNISTVMLGNLPDKTRAEKFFRNNSIRSPSLDDHNSALGIWRTPEEIAHMIKKTGWHLQDIYYMPAEYHAAHYRYDVVLERLHG